MQDHLFASNRQHQPYVGLNSYPNNNAALFSSSKKFVLIDLCAMDEPSLTKDHATVQQNAPFWQKYSPSNRILGTTNAYQQTSRVISKSESEGTSSTSIRTYGKPNAILNQFTTNQPARIQVYDVDDFVSIQTNSHNRPNVQPKTKNAIQPFVIESTGEESSIRPQKHGLNESNKRLFQSLVVQRPFSLPINEMVSLDEGIQRKKTNQTFNSREVEVKQVKRRTRNRIRTEGEFFEDPDDIDFYDEEVKKRMKVAKYRYSISESSKAINELVPKVSNRIHSGNTIATVQPFPTIPFNSQKHRIFIECLKLQFRKRKFVYLE